MCSPNENLGKSPKSPRAKTVKTTKPTGELSRNLGIAANVLDGLTREELRALAIATNTPRGRNKTNTVSNLVAAIKEGKAHVKSLVTISTPPPDGQSFGGTTLLVKKLRTYKIDRTITAPPLTV